MANRSIWTVPVRREISSVRATLRKVQNYFSDKEKVACPDGQGSRPDAHVTKLCF
jgi:hypothetical protein